MQITISSRQGTLSPALADYLRQKLSKLLRIFQRIENIEATVRADSDQTEIELLVNAEHKYGLVARERAGGYHEAVDLVVHKMEEQLRRYKQRIQQHRGRTSMSGQ